MQTVSLFLQNGWILPERIGAFRRWLQKKNENMTIIDRIKGAIYGQAIGDALGLATEFMPKSEVLKAYPNGIHNYQDIQTDGHTERWEKGDWTDDTDQMLCILDAILQEGNLSILAVSKKLKEWYLNEPTGIGETVFKVLSNDDFLSDPHRVSKNVWKESGEKSAANGGIMRTSILGIWGYENIEKVKLNAQQICQITHYDPRCVASCVAVCLIIRELLINNENDQDILDKVLGHCLVYDHSIKNIFSTLPLKIEDLELDASTSIGYTYKALAAGLWVLKYSASFEEGIQSIIFEGGDADTNASVGGAILGAKFGYKNIPERLKQGLLHKNDLDARIEKLLILMSCI